MGGADGTEGVAGGRGPIRGAEAGEPLPQTGGTTHPPKVCLNAPSISEIGSLWMGEKLMALSPPFP